MVGAGKRLPMRWPETRKVRAALIVATILMSSIGNRVARADTSWDPSGKRMAATDRSTGSDIQPRVWFLTTGGASGYPGRLLVTRIRDVNQSAWYYQGVAGCGIGNRLDMGLDAVRTRT